MISHRRAPLRRSQYLRLRDRCHAWLAREVERGGREVEEAVLFLRADLEDAAGAWGEDILRAARDTWVGEGGPSTFGRWLREREDDLFERAALTFIAGRRRAMTRTESLEVA